MIFTSLLMKYKSGRIKADDFKLLSEYTRNLSDNDLDSSLEALWNEADRKVMDAQTKTEVKEVLHRQLFATNKKSFWSRWNIAAVVLLPLFAVLSAYMYINLRQQAAQEFIVESAKGQKTQVHLPDGSTVWLNSASSISYNSNYNQKNRSISLKGEAFFDVKENKKTMFIVDVGGVSVNVLGTAFNVTAYEDDSIVNVSLNRGLVSVENTYNHKILSKLVPNQQVAVNRNNLSAALSECDAELNSLWTQNKLKLEDATTETMFRKIEHWYGVNIRVSNINPDNIYSLTVKTESLREMLDLINRLTPISYQINGEEVHVSYK